MSPLNGEIYHIVKHSGLHCGTQWSEGESVSAVFPVLMVGILPLDKQIIA